jgi:hypothetical protein
MILLAIAYIAGCLTVPLAVWGVFRYDRWAIAREALKEERTP